MRHAGRKVDPSRFAMTPMGHVQRSALDTKHGHRTTFDGGRLIPIYVDEVLPGDSHRVNLTAFARFATPLVPVMDNARFETFFFFCPNRILWDNWERFMGEQANPSDTTSFLTPYVAVTTAVAGRPSLYDYFGITTNNTVGGVLNVSALPFRAYNRIFNDFFRDQDLTVKLPENTGDGPDAVGDYLLVNAAKRPDYFTTARPWPEKPSNQLSTGSMMGAQFRPGGDFLIPRGAIGAPVTGLGVLSSASPTAGAPTTLQPGVRNVVLNNPHWITTDDAFYMNADSTASYPDVKILVNDLRTAVLVQGFLERNARGGTRYAEIVRAHFGVISPDARLQRPEYLGGGRSWLSINPIAQTSASGVAGTDTNLGDQAGVGSVIATGHGFSQSFTEHGWIIGLACVRADLSYQQGVERMWFRRTIFDFYWPGLDGLGEQAIERKEIYATGVSADDETIFGYQERWSEYKNKPSRVSGAFRSTDPTPLDVWHWAENFTSVPVLNSSFIEDSSNIQFARTQVASGWESQQILCDCLFDMRRVRPMPVVSIPGMGVRL